ncbi:hypothetical protein A6A04_20005 [Paramagnetospirillum marisnigri]|uniref:Uncharacterized protein n=1 Tax=Paramagnetospirillum marisnigri TaxID=1285242 RepID=A0A178MKT9_9PROT|nr:hypothetical protein [Paramagnetospirillum marisnigri]OAN48665.1 hypothetical protein A6A04_20005 [Paramagnetospirillum marisnigri]
MAGRVPIAYYLLAGRVLTFLEKCAGDPNVGENDFAVWMLLNVSQGGLRDRLLFRDRQVKQGDAYFEFEVPAHIASKFGVKRKVSIHTRAIGFVAMAVFKRLIVIASSKRLGGRSKAHLLYNTMLAYSPKFEDARILRKGGRNDRMSKGSCRITRQIAKRAAGEILSKGSASPSMIKELGKLYLECPEGDVPFPEELGCGDIIDCLPFPLEISEVPFKKPMIGPFADLLCSAGERYKLLRRCGLDPDQWFDSEEPTTNQMREMIDFGKLVVADAKFHPDSSLEEVAGAIWRVKPVPKVGSFDDFMGSAWGRRFLETLPATNRLPSAILLTDEIDEIAERIEAYEDELGDETRPTRTSIKQLCTLIAELVEKHWLTKVEGYYLHSLVNGVLTIKSALEDKTLRQMLIDENGNPEGESHFQREQRLNECFDSVRRLSIVKISTYLDSENGIGSADKSLDLLTGEG